MNGTESMALESTEERMKSVDRDFDEYGDCNIKRKMSYMFLFAGFLIILAKMWTGIHLHGLSFHTGFQAIALPLFFFVPFFDSLQFSRYIRSALKENLVSERVAKNCEFLDREPAIDCLSCDNAICHMGLISTYGSRH
jgi:hypothetical protein